LIVSNAKLIAVSAVFFVSSGSARAALEALPDEQTMSTEQRTMLDPDAARELMLTLINKDRASVGAPPVVTDDDVAIRVGQLHSDEMAVNGYLSHWTMDGQKPDQRYCEAGGKDAVAENAFLSSEVDVDDTGVIRKIPLHQVQIFKRYELEKMESDFFNEKPPYDGHRKNIIDPTHTSVGIGLSFASSFGMGTRFACTQEFVNHYGEYGDIPAKIKIGEKLHVAGKLNKGVHLKSIDFRGEELPKPMTVAELNKTSSYSIPEKVTVTAFVDASQTNDPIKVTTSDGQEEFSADVPIDDAFQPGLYYMCAWAAAADGRSEDTLISCRTFVVEEAAKP
jgi:hypothetical protein